MTDRLAPVPALDAMTRFHIARAEAIESHAGLEQALLHLFTALLNFRYGDAMLILTRVVSTRKRNEIISSIITNRLGDQSKRFNRSLFKEIVKADQI